MDALRRRGLAWFRMGGSGVIGICGAAGVWHRQFARGWPRFVRRAGEWLACALLLPLSRIAGTDGLEAEPPSNDANLAEQRKMLNTKPHIVTHGVDGDAMTLVFYPDTGCLRFVDARGICHELRPPHSWFAISSASRGVRRSTQAMTEGLNALLQDFCAKRPRWLSGSARRAGIAPLTLSTPAPARATMVQLTTSVAVAR